MLSLLLIQTNANSFYRLQLLNTHVVSAKADGEARTICAHSTEVRGFPKRLRYRQEDRNGLSCSARHGQQLETGSAITVTTLLQVPFHHDDRLRSSYLPATKRRHSATWP